MGPHATDIACVARRLGQVLDARDDQCPDLRAVVELAQARGDTGPPSIEAVEELLCNMSPWSSAAPHTSLRGAAFNICCALEGVLVLPGMTDRIQRYLRCATAHIDAAITSPLTQPSDR